jgi:hypothetical protein
MELLSIGFAILLIKMTICVVSGAFGVFCIVSSEETKRELRRTVCHALFGVGNAIPFRKFDRLLRISGSVLLLFSALACWFLLLRGLFS